MPGINQPGTSSSRCTPSTASSRAERAQLCSLPRQRRREGNSRSRWRADLQAEGPARHQEAGLKQRQVEALAVEGDDPLERLQGLLQGVEYRLLRVVIVHEELADDEARSRRSGPVLSGTRRCRCRLRDRLSRYPGRRSGRGPSSPALVPVPSTTAPGAPPRAPLRSDASRRAGRRGGGAPRGMPRRRAWTGSCRARPRRSACRSGPFSRGVAPRQVTSVAPW